MEFQSFLLKRIIYLVGECGMWNVECGWLYCASDRRVDKFTSISLHIFGVNVFMFNAKKDVFSHVKPEIG